MLDFLKSICNLYDLYFIWFILSAIWLLFIYRKLKRGIRPKSAKQFFRVLPKIFQFNIIFALAFYLICATSYVPKKLLFQKESTFDVLNVASLDSTKTYYIHILGSGYLLDERLYATQKLSLSSLSRLTEAIRIYHQHPQIILVTSAYSKYGLETQASITKKAAIELGVDADQILMLTEPSTTSEEVNAFVSRFGTDVHLIVSSDASHLPRAIQMYAEKGIEAIAAPTNFEAKVDVNHPIQFSFPTSRSFELANHYFVVITKEWYYKISGK